MTGNKNLSVEVSFIGSIAEKAACNHIGFDRVHDLVDVIHRLESEYPFLRTMSYAVDVNAQHVEKNLMLSDGDKVEIRPGRVLN